MPDIYVAGQAFPSPSSANVGGPRRIWRDDFNGAAPDPAFWPVAARTVSGGATVSNSAGALRIDLGTTAGATVILQSAQYFRLPARLICGVQASQRIIGNEFFVELVSIDPETGLPDGRNSASIQLSGSGSQNAFAGIYNGQGGSLQSATGIGTNIDWTAGYCGFEIEIDQEQLAMRTCNALSGVVASSGFQRIQDVPDPTAIYAVRIRATNSSAPASNTQFRVAVLSVMEYDELFTEATGQRGRDFANGMTVNGSAGIAPSGNFPNNFDYLGPASAGTPTGLIVSTAANPGELYAWNVGASWAFLKLYNQTTAPTAGAGTPVRTIGIPPNSATHLIFLGAFRLSSGLAWAITGGAAATDTTAIAAGQVGFSLSRN